MDQGLWGERHSLAVSVDYFNSSKSLVISRFQVARRQ